MKTLPLLLLLLALACKESEQDKTKKDLNHLGKSVEKSAEKAKDKVEEAVKDLKHDSTVKKISNQLKDIGDRSR